MRLPVPVTREANYCDAAWLGTGVETQATAPALGIVLDAGHQVAMAVALIRKSENALRARDNAAAAAFALLRVDDGAWPLRELAVALADFINDGYDT